MSIIQKIIIGGLGTATFLGAGLAVMAETHPMADDRPRRPMVVEIGPSGRALLRGTVSALGDNLFTVKSWGGDWTINTSTATKFLPLDISQLKADLRVGDFVGVQGLVNQAAQWTIDATLVRNWDPRKSAAQAARKERRNNQQEIREVIKNESPKNWQGTASNINADAKTFTLTMGGTAYTVELVAEAKVVNQTFLTMNFADVKNGDTVRVWGPLNGTIISAYVLRDISLK